MYRKVPNLVILALLFSISAIFLVQQNQKIAAQNIQAEFDQIGSTLSQQIALITGPLILSEDWVSVNVTLKQLTQNDFILSADIISPKGDILAQVGKPSNQAFKQTIGPENTPLGTVRLYLDEDYLSLFSRQKAKKLSGLLIASHLLLFIIVAFILRRTQVHHGSDTANSTTVTNPIEEAEMSVSFNVTTDQIEDQQASSMTESPLNATPPEQTFTYPESAATITTKPESPDAKSTTRLTTATTIRYFVIFINCRQGSSHLLENAAREELLQLYQQLFERVCEIYRGTFSQDQSGNWLAQFPQQILQEQEADLQLKIHCGSNALCAAQLFKSLYRKLNQQRILQMKPVLNLKIGLVAGERPEQLISDAQDITNEIESNEVITSEDLYGFAPLRQLMMDAGVVTKAEKGNYLVHQLAKDFQQLIDRQAEHFLQTATSTITPTITPTAATEEENI